MLYPKEPSLSAELFRHPTAAYRAAPFWAWNCKLEKETLDRQMPVFQEMGMGGFHMHVRTGLDTPYLSDEFMERIRKSKSQPLNVLTGGKHWHTVEADTEPMLQVIGEKLREKGYLQE